MKMVKFDGSRTPEPDSMGFFAHPDLPNEVDGKDFYKALLKMGFDSSLCQFSEDAPTYSVESWFFNQSQAEMKKLMNDWNPTRPEGEGWILVSKFDSDDGPFALFVKKTAGSEVKQ